MAQVGGFRPGAGRPVGGISESRRVLDLAIRRGLADAVRDSGHIGSDDDLAAAGAAEIVRQMIRSGQGDRVLAIWSQVAPKDEPRANGAGAGDSPLSSALGRMPGADGAPVAHLPGAVVAEDGANVDDADQWAADSQSAGGAGEAPQAGLPRIGRVLLPGQLVLGVEAGARAPAVLATPPAPTPPSAPARGVIHPHGSNFDFVAEGRFQSGDDDDGHDCASDALVVGGIARTGAAA